MWFCGLCVSWVLTNTDPQKITEFKLPAMTLFRRRRCWLFAPVPLVPAPCHRHRRFRGMVSLIAGKNKGEKRDTEETVEEKRRRKAQIKLNKRVSTDRVNSGKYNPFPL